MNLDLEKVFYLLLGAILTLGGRWVIELIRDKRRKSKIEDNMNNKIITATTLCKLTPGKSIDIMKQLLGEPLVYREDDFDLQKYTQDPDYAPFVGEIQPPENILKSYTYKFKNTSVKITSYDNKRINSLTIIPHHKQKLDISDIFFDDMILNKTKFTKKLSEWYGINAMYTSTRDYFAFAKIGLSNPHYKYFTFFFDDSESLGKYANSKDIKDLIGLTINGICITSFATEEIYYIFIPEIL